MPIAARRRLPVVTIDKGEDVEGAGGDDLRSTIKSGEITVGCGNVAGYNRSDDGDCRWSQNVGFNEKNSFGWLVSPEVARQHRKMPRK